ncbi:MAG: hypothetical protein K2X03_22455 [Bryobacteraceae bacterium]|nr:hypothetical protein [Bryobacteraceae bacterium]
MTTQSSFLIRCWLDLDAGGAAKIYSIQHVQTGAEFRAHDLDEIVRWMQAENVRFAAQASEGQAPQEKEASE